MGRPVDSRYFGANGIKVAFNRGGDINVGWIVRQLSGSTFIVDDGDGEMVARLAPMITDPNDLPLGGMLLRAYRPGTASDADIDVYFGATTFFSGLRIVSGGSGYTVGTVLRITTAGAVAPVELTVSSVSGGAVTGVTVSNPGKLRVNPAGTVSSDGMRRTISGSDITRVSGTGTGISVDIGFIITDAVINNAGSGYADNTFAALTGADFPLMDYIAILEASDGAVVSVNYSLNPPPMFGTFNNAKIGPAEGLAYANRLTSKMVRMVDGAMRSWTISSTPEETPPNGVRFSTF